MVLNNGPVTCMSHCYMVTTGIPQVTWMLLRVNVVMTGVNSCTRTARIIIVSTAATVVTILGLLVCTSLAVLFAFHSFILKPNLDLAL
jgi:hypothetical protein